MNDFMIQELEEIKRCLKHIIESGITPYSDFTIDVNEKVKSMIDNYYKQSTKCPKCTNMRVADGMCWNIECDYHE